MNTRTMKQALPQGRRLFAYLIVKRSRSLTLGHWIMMSLNPYEITNLGYEAMPFLGE
ncbi:hypothetical protein [Paenibacillus sp. Root52]|uniref:hypothetical protein n=1 Tax=Paenibacillus sp. Root52 TaxID=1736552 RepID=UPI0012E34EEB|nr:hypothetical protein [Paenibacillus sp. Root52]